MNYDPSKDGIDHINIYSKAKTSLGLFLSNFTKCDLETEDGEFASIEGYWYWLSSPDEYPPGQKYVAREELRNLSGWYAKKFGRLVRGAPDFDADKDSAFQEKIKKALQYKIDNSSLKKQFAISTLPFQHYYVYDGKILEPDSGKWQITFFEEYRKQLKEEYGKMSSLQQR